MKRLSTPIAAALAAVLVSLLGTACKSSDPLEEGRRTHDPLYDSHWNVGSLGWRASYHAFGYDASQGKTLLEHEKEVSRDLALTIRRHLLNDDPENPLQLRRGIGGDSVYNPTSIVSDTYYLAREGVINGARGVATAALLVADFAVGPIVSIFGVDFGGITEWDADDGSPLGDPNPPEDFRIKNR